MGFDDIIKRNEKALGRARVEVPPTLVEESAPRCCPKCRAEVKLLGVERVAAQSTALRSSRYQCMTCLHAFGVPNPITLALVVGLGVGFLVVAALMFAGVMTVKESQRIGLSAIILGFGVVFSTWGVRAARASSRSIP